MIRKQVSWWPGNVEVGGTHVHHLVWGICAMMIFGYVGVVHQPGSPWWEIVTAFFAIGMGLALDEFALWVELKDVYWEKDGRKSIDAMIIAGCAAGVLLVGFSSWATLADSVEDEVFFGVGAFGLVGIVVAARQRGEGEALVGAGLLIFWPVGDRCPRSGWRSRTRSGRGASTARATGSSAPSERYGVTGAASGPPPATPAPEPEPSPSGSGSSAS